MSVIAIYNPVRPARRRRYHLPTVRDVQSRVTACGLRVSYHWVYWWQWQRPASRSLPWCKRCLATRLGELAIAEGWCKRAA